jgi:hypothetical protein
MTPGSRCQAPAKLGLALQKPLTAENAPKNYAIVHLPTGGTASSPVLQRLQATEPSGVGWPEPSRSLPTPSWLQGWKQLSNP